MPLRHPPHGRGTVGMVQVHPNSRNVIPGRVKFSIDITPVSACPAQPFDADCVQAVARAAERLGHSAMPVVSGAGHEAVYMAWLAPAGMIFVPCKDALTWLALPKADEAPAASWPQPWLAAAWKATDNTFW